MPHSCIGFLDLLVESLVGSPNAMVPSFRARALSGCPAAEVLRPHGCEMLAGLYRPEWSDKDALTNLLAVLPIFRRAIGDSIAAPCSFHLNPDPVQCNVSSDNWNCPSRGAAYARS